MSINFPRFVLVIRVVNAATEASAICARTLAVSIGTMLAGSAELSCSAGQSYFGVNKVAGAAIIRSANTPNSLDTNILASAFSINTDW